MSYVIIDTDLAGTDALLGVVHDGALAEVIKGELRRRDVRAEVVPQPADAGPDWLSPP
jgi:hypothetical protein